MTLHQLLAGGGLLAISLLVAALPYPGRPDSFWASFLLVLGRLAPLRFSDSPGTLHLPGTAQPPPDPWQRLQSQLALAAPLAPPELREHLLRMGVAVAQRLPGLVPGAALNAMEQLRLAAEKCPLPGELLAALRDIDATLREAQALPPRSVPWPAALALLLVLALGPLACVRPLDQARQQFTAALQVTTAAQTRLKTWDAQHQLDLVSAAEKREVAVKALAAYRDQRRRVEQLARDTEAVMDEAADQLLLSDQPAALDAAQRAQLAASRFRAAVQALMGGGG